MACSPFDSLLDLSNCKDMWNYLKPNNNTNNYLEIINSMIVEEAGDKHEYPKTLIFKHIKSMRKVYDSCVARNQYLPQLVTEDNCRKIFQAGAYCGESKKGSSVENFQLSYPLCVRPMECTNIDIREESSYYPEESHILSDLCENFSDSDSDQVDIDVTPFKKKENHHFAAYLKSVEQNVHLQDQVEGLQINCIVAVVGEGRGKKPWFGRVLDIDIEQEFVLVKWLHEHKSKYIYKDDKADWVSNETIICNGVVFAPVFKDDLFLWKLITPMPFIRNMNVQKYDLVRAQTKGFINSRIKSIDITGMKFRSAKELEEFVLST